MGAITCWLPAAPELWSPRWRGEGARDGKSEARWVLAATAGSVLCSLLAVGGGRERTCNDLPYNEHEDTSTSQVTSELAHTCEEGGCGRPGGASSLLSSRGGYGSTARDVGVMLMTPGSSGKLEERQSPEGR